MQRETTVVVQPVIDTAPNAAGKVNSPFRVGSCPPNRKYVG